MLLELASRKVFSVLSEAAIITAPVDLARYWTEEYATNVADAAVLLALDGSMRVDGFAALTQAVERRPPNPTRRSGTGTTDETGRRMWEEDALRSRRKPGVEKPRPVLLQRPQGACGTIRPSTRSKIGESTTTSRGARTSARTGRSTSPSIAAITPSRARALEDGLDTTPPPPCAYPGCGVAKTGVIMRVVFAGGVSRRGPEDRSSPRVFRRIRARSRGTNPSASRDRAACASPPTGTCSWRPWTAA